MKQLPQKTSLSDKSRYNDQESTDSKMLFENLEWLTTKEAAYYLRRSVNAIHILVSRGKIRSRKFQRRLYFKKNELDYLIETSSAMGGF